MTNLRLKFALSILTLMLSAGCAFAPQQSEERTLAWKEAPGKNHDEMYKDSTVCMREGRKVRIGYTREIDKYTAQMITYRDCMLAEGHSLIEVAQ